MFGIGIFELLLIALVCFIAIGPKQLPQVMRKLAGFYRQFTNLRDEFKFQLLSADDDVIAQHDSPSQKKVTASQSASKPTVDQEQRDGTA